MQDNSVTEVPGLSGLQSEWAIFWYILVRAFFRKWRKSPIFRDWNSSITWNTGLRSGTRGFEGKSRSNCRSKTAWYPGSPSNETNVKPIEWFAASWSTILAQSYWISLSANPDWWDFGWIGKIQKVTSSGANRKRKIEFSCRQLLSSVVLIPTVSDMTLIWSSADKPQIASDPALVRLVDDLDLKIST
jgi:hypothetical protein